MELYSAVSVSKANTSAFIDRTALYDYILKTNRHWNRRHVKWLDDGGHLNSDKHSLDQLLCVTPAASRPTYMCSSCLKLYVESIFV